MNKMMAYAAAGPYRVCAASWYAKTDIVSTRYLPGPIMPYGRSNMRSVSRVRKRTATTSAGLTIGSVIRTNCCQVVAPSTLAAS